MQTNTRWFFILFQYREDTIKILLGGMIEIKMEVDQ